MLLCLAAICCRTILTILSVPCLPTYGEINNTRNKQKLFVGILLTAQPEFIAGIEDVGEAKSNAFGAMGMFIGTLCLSVFGILRSNTNDKEEEDAGYQLSGMSNHQQTEEYTARYD